MSRSQCSADLLKHVSNKILILITNSWWACGLHVLSCLCTSIWIQKYSNKRPRPSKQSKWSFEVSLFLFVKDFQICSLSCRVGLLLRGWFRAGFIEHCIPESITSVFPSGWWHWFVHFWNSKSQLSNFPQYKLLSNMSTSETKISKLLLSNHAIWYIFDRK